MKKRYLTVALISAIAASLSLSSCIGSFALSNKLLDWNNTIDNKFVNEAVFFVFWVLPVYEVAIIADALVLNTIEFWSGESPIVENKIIDGNDGKYLIERDQNGYTITSLNDKVSIRLNYDLPKRTWSVVDTKGEEYPIFTFVDDTHIMVPDGKGDMIKIEKTQEALYAYQEQVMSTLVANR